MRWKRTLQLLDVHCEGEIGRVVTGGAPKIPGNTVAEQLHWMNTDPQGEALRRFLTLEPRGEHELKGLSGPRAIFALQR